PAHRHAWTDRTVGFAATAGTAGVLLLRDSGHPPRSELHRIADSAVAQSISLPAAAVGTPSAAAAGGAAVLLVPAPRTLQLGAVALVRGAAPITPFRVLDVRAPEVIDGALLIRTEPDVWAIAVASSHSDAATATPSGEPLRREGYALVAFDAQVHAAG